MRAAAADSVSAALSPCEIRNGHEADASANQASAASALHGHETRIQQDMIEMLATKLAKKERENELFRVQQQALDNMRASYEDELRQLRASSETARDKLAEANQQLQRQHQLLQAQYDRLREDGEARNAAALEVKRLREKEQAAARALDLERQGTIEQLRSDLRRSFADRSALEAKLVTALNQQQALRDQILQFEARALTQEERLRAEQQMRLGLESQAAVAAAALSQEQRARADVELQLQRAIQEKQTLDEKHRLLSKTVRDASVKAADADKKRQQLTKSEDDLAVQVAQLKRENDELKARRGQMSAQAKHLSSKVMALEKSEASAQLKLRDALAEVESARTCTREHQFRIKQLQEELVFVEKRKAAWMKD
ncbi:hypothetical protein PybrP1_004400 [[Pythium] brassicae (nom. inval.)]|nr:hypothetical protein PybrP1_004400 [[Pythium] brassicae (nom. inval.)]